MFNILYRFKKIKTGTWNRNFLQGAVNKKGQSQLKNKQTYSEENQILKKDD